jgi:NADPH:quinone reductase-like Zn-dependent oxidoreductase
MELAPFARTLSFVSVDTSYAFHLFPERLRPVIEELRAGFAAGTFGTLPTKVFSNDDIIGAFRFMTTGQHIGRVAVDLKRTQPLVTAS